MITPEPPREIREFALRVVASESLEEKLAPAPAGLREPLGLAPDQRVRLVLGQGDAAHGDVPEVHHAPMGGTRQRPHHAVRRRARDRGRLTP